MLTEAVIHAIPSSDAIDTQLEQVTQYSDVQLWAIIKEAFPTQYDQRMHTLTEMRKKQTLATEEQAELEQLIEAYAKYELLHASVLVELKNRDYDVDAYLDEHAPR